MLKTYPANTEKKTQSTMVKTVISKVLKIYLDAGTELDDMVSNIFAKFSSVQLRGKMVGGNLKSSSMGLNALSSTNRTGILMTTASGSRNR